MTCRGCGHIYHISNGIPNMVGGIALSTPHASSNFTHSRSFSPNTRLDDKRIRVSAPPPTPASDASTADIGAICSVVPYLG
jgi:hypothetical protein